MLPHRFVGVVAGVADRDCLRCGLPDRHPIHYGVPGDDQTRAETGDFRRRFSSAMPPPPGKPGPPEPPRLPARGADRRYGALVHAAVTLAGVVALLHRWRRPGSRWVL